MTTNTETVKPSDAALEAEALMHNVPLSDAELATLDGVCNPKAQAVVQSALARLSLAKTFPTLTPKQVEFVVKVREEATEQKKLIYRQYHNIRRCDVCGRNDGYYLRTRASRYHNKGTPDYDKPKTFTAIELSDQPVRMIGYTSLGCCERCLESVRPALIHVLEGVVAEIAEQIINVPPRFRRMDNFACTKCDWKGHEGQMGRSLTLIGNGTYPSTCPQCKAENSLFFSNVKRTGEYTVIEIVTGNQL